MKEVARVPLASLANGELLRVRYPPYDVLVTLVDGVPEAIEDACNHAGASLADGWREGDRGECIACPMHGYVFDLRSGALLRPRGLCESQRKFVARVVGSDVVVYDPVSVVIF